jgi:hypothetical protein
MVIKTGHLSQFALRSMVGYAPTIELIPSGPGVAGEYFLASRNVEAKIAADGSFTVELIPNEQVSPDTHYRMRIIWLDEASNFTSIDDPDWQFVISNVNGPLADDASKTPNSLEVWVGADNNPDYRFWYNPVTADLRSNP